MMQVRLIVVLILLAVSANTLAANEKEPSIGKIIFALGQVNIIKKDGSSVRAKKGSQLISGDIIKTAARGQAQLRFIDQAYISVRPNSEFKVAEYVFNQKDIQSQKSEFELVKGGFRAVTGMIGKQVKGNYKVRTPVATIGIRGTDYSVMYCENGCRGELGKVAKDGLYVGVIKGGVNIQNNDGSVDLDPNQYAMVGSLNQAPQRLAKPPSFLMFDKSIATEDDREVMIRRPANQDAKKEVETASVKSADDDASTENSKSNGRERDLDAVATSLAKRFEPSDTELPESNIVEPGNDLLDVNLPAPNVTFASDEPSVKDLLVDNLAELQEQTGLSDSVSGVLLGDNDSAINHPAISLSSSLFATTTLNEQSFLMGELTQNGRLSSFYMPKLSSADENDYLFFQSGTTIERDYGFDPDTGLAWGRWSDGSIEKTVSVLNDPESVSLIDDSLHWILGTDTAQTIQLPITGTQNYVLIGNTNPTDNFGHVGTLGSASLTADFESRTLDATLQLSIDNGIWNASQSGVAIDNQTGRFFSDQMSVGVQTGTNTVSGSGIMSGGFVGQDANGAAMSYSLNADGTTVSGVAAFEAAVQGGE